MLCYCPVQSLYDVTSSLCRAALGTRMELPLKIDLPLIPRPPQQSGWRRHWASLADSLPVCYRQSYILLTVSRRADRDKNEKYIF